MCLTRYTFVTEGIAANVTDERLGPRMLAVMIVQLGLGLETFGAHITDKLAVARMELGMPFEKGGFFKTLVAALEVTDKSFGGMSGMVACICRGHDGRDIV